MSWSFAATYFNYGLNNVLIGDGRQLLAEQADGRLDYIVLDAFTKEGTPRHLSTLEFFRLAKEKLGDRGMLLLNRDGEGKRRQGRGGDSLRRCSASFRPCDGRSCCRARGGRGSEIWCWPHATGRSVTNGRRWPGSPSSCRRTATSSRTGAGERRAESKRLTGSSSRREGRDQAVAPFFMAQSAFRRSNWRFGQRPAKKSARDWRFCAYRRGMPSDSLRERAMPLATHSIIGG